MSSKTFSTLDANEAVAGVAYRLSETIAIYPITPSSPMAESCDEWSAANKKNLWGTVPRLIQMQSEGGVAGAVHGMTQVGSLTTTFTASQGLLLMIPNMYKIAGELLPFVMHVTARTLAAHALSIFGDHGDVMACRQTGWAMLCSNSTQEAQDMAAIAHAATLESRVPFLHFFDGFRTSHEVDKIKMLPEDALLKLVNEECISAFRDLALTPDRPAIRGTAQNPDVYFQAREACNPFYDKTPEIVERTMARFAELTGRQYKLFSYYGHPEADRVIIAMGSGCEVAEETIDYLNAKGEKVGLLKVHLFRPFSLRHFAEALPKTVRSIAVLDRTKEPGSVGEPLYQDIVTALSQAKSSGISPLEVEPVVISGRYGLASKEFDPAMVKAVYEELKRERPKLKFTVGINDDVTGLSLPVDAAFDIEPDSVVRSVFFGLGSDGTVGANKNSIKIIGEETENQAQGYFVYDSKKSGAVTISHLRFGPNKIKSHYLIKRANFVACHHFPFVEQYDILSYAVPGAVFLLNTPLAADKAFEWLPREMQEQIVDKKLKFYVIDAIKVAHETGMGGRINTIMQTCFFAISGVLPREEAITRIKKAIEKTYGRKGEAVVQKNFAAVDATLAALHEVKYGTANASRTRRAPVADEAPDFVRRVTGLMLAGRGDELPVSAFPVDGTWPTGTAKWEKRNIAQEVPIWESDLCIQCNKCSLVCPHAAIRSKFYPEASLAGAPASFRSVNFRSNENPGCKFTIQVAPEDCTGCTLCVQVCPAKDKTNPRRKAINMQAQAPLLDAERENFNFFLNIANPDRSKLKLDVKSSQFMEPLFEYSGACAGCGETPYVKLLTQLFGDRAIIANATGCSSIYGGNLPTTPYTVDANGRGPAWSNSLFEDNAEYGLGMRCGIDKLTEIARELTAKLAPQLGDSFVQELLHTKVQNETEIAEQRKRVVELRDRLSTVQLPEAKRLDQLAQYLVPKSVWIMGGDGWAYDIGYGGLDHVLSLGKKVNILVLDTECYSNTGGQMSKSTPMGAVAKFAVGGKETAKKDLGLIAMSYGNVYVARVALGAKDAQTLKAFAEAEAFPGTSIIIAYSHCIAHGYALHLGLEQQKLAVESGSWPLYRFDPRREEAGQAALQIDSAAPKGQLSNYQSNELRFRLLEKTAPDRAKELLGESQSNVTRRYDLYSQMATFGNKDDKGTTDSTATPVNGGNK